MNYQIPHPDGANQLVNKKSSFLSRLLPEYSWILLILSFIWNLAAYYLARLISHGMYHRVLELPLDDKIPVIPCTVILYALFFPFWLFNYALVSKRDRDFAIHFFTADFLSRIICFIFFITIPTTLVQPEIADGAFCGWMLRIVYFFDEPDNLFPSIHCLGSILAAGGIQGDENVPKWYRTASLFIAIAICLSTLTTKQHLAIDLFSGVALAGVVWLVAENKAITAFYTKIVDKIYCLIFRKKR